ncbi:MAG: hypothetical protein WDO13_12735 [Verrucomicrobiota bacterium]
MALGIFILTALIAFFYTRAFRLHLFLLGVVTACAVFAFGYYLLDPGLDKSER